jgi:hypothetical protein
MCEVSYGRCLSNFYLHFTVRLIQWLLITEMSGASTVPIVSWPPKEFQQTDRQAGKNGRRNLSLLPSGLISRPMKEDSFDWKEEAEV